MNLTWISTLVKLKDWTRDVVALQIALILGQILVYLALGTTHNGGMLVVQLLLDRRKFGLGPVDGTKLSTRIIQTAPTG